MTLDEYVSWALQQQPYGIDVDGAHGPQCVDEVQDYASKLGHPFPLVEGAKDFAGMSIPGWTWAPNTPEAIPPPGAIVIWGTGIGPYGHVALRTSRPADATRFQTVDQNWFNSSERGSPPALVDHGYTGVLGWFLPAEGAVSMGVPAFQTRKFHGRCFRTTSWFDAPGGSPVADITVDTEDDFDARADGDELWIRGMKDGLSGAWWTKDADWDTDSFGGTPVALVKEPPPAPPPVAPVTPPADPPALPGTPVEPTLADVVAKLDAIAAGVDELLGHHAHSNVS